MAATVTIATPAIIATTASKVARMLLQEIDKGGSVNYRVIDSGCSALYTLGRMAGDHPQLGYHLASLNDAILDAAEYNERLNYEAVLNALFVGAGL